MRGWKKVVIFDEETKAVGYVVTVVFMDVVYFRNDRRQDELINSICHGQWRRRGPGP